LSTIGFDGNGSLNRLASVDLSKDPDLIAIEEDSKLPSDEKDIVHDLQDQAIIEDDELIKIIEVTRGQKDFSPTSQETVTVPVLETQVRPVRSIGLTEADRQVRLVTQTSQTGHGLKNPEMSKFGHPEVDGGKDRVKYSGKMAKLSFDELLVKYQNDNEAKRANRSNKVKSSRLQHVLLLSHQCRFHMLHIPLVLILIHHGGGVIHGHILLHILDHIMLSMQLQDDHRMQGSHMLEVTVLSIKIGVLKTRKRWSSKLTE
jgi:hypothetical protein